MIRAALFAVLFFGGPAVADECEHPWAASEAFGRAHGAVIAQLAPEQTVTLRRNYDLMHLDPPFDRTFTGSVGGVLHIFFVRGECVVRWGVLGVDELEHLLTPDYYAVPRPDEGLPFRLMPGRPA